MVLLPRALHPNGRTFPKSSPGETCWPLAGIEEGDGSIPGFNHRTEGRAAPSFLRCWDGAGISFLTRMGSVLLSSRTSLGWCLQLPQICFSRGLCSQQHQFAVLAQIPTPGGDSWIMGSILLFLVVANVLPPLSGTGDRPWGHQQGALSVLTATPSQPHP